MIKLENSKILGVNGTERIVMVISDVETDGEVKYTLDFPGGSDGK